MAFTVAWRAALSVAVLALAGCASNRVTRVASDVLIDDTDVYPESLSSTRAGALYVGSIKGIIYRALPGAGHAAAWVRPDDRNGLQAVFGVLAHEPTRTLWICSVPNPFAPPVAGRVAELIALDLDSGALKARYPFPAPRSVCNDMTVAADGSVYATDTQNGRLLRLRRGSTAVEVFAADEQLKGADGIAFDSRGRLYVNIVSRGALLRVDVARDARLAALVPIAVDQPLGGPDGMRLIEANRFLLAEGTAGRIDELTIEGTRAHVRVLKSGLESSPGVTRVGATAYAIEGKIGYLIDPALKGKDPGPFKVTAIPLR